MKFVKLFFAAAVGVALLSCGDSTHPTGPSESNAPTIRTDAVTSEGAGGPSITTDKGDYVPGDTVTITGNGWQPNESVALLLEETPSVHEPMQWNVTADSAGGFVDKTFEVQQHDLGAAFTLYATGAASADTAQGTFTDGALNAKTNLGSVLLNWNVYSNSDCTSSSPTSGSHTIDNSSGNGYAIVSAFASGTSVGITSLGIPGGTSFIEWVSGSDHRTQIATCFNSGGNWIARFGYNTTTALTADLASPQVSGTSITFSATVTKNLDASAVSAGKVTIYDGGTCTSPGPTLKTETNLPALGVVTLTTDLLSVGSHTILACYGGAGDLLGSSGTMSFTINAPSVATSTVIAPSPASPSEYGTSVTFTATVAQTVGGSAVTSGNVSFHDTNCAGTVLQAAAAVNGSGQKTYTTTSLSVGAHTIAACYEGASAFDTSNGTAAYTINKVATGTVVTTNLTSPQNVGAPVTFTAIVTRNTGVAAVTVGNVRFIEGGICASPTATLQSATAVSGSGQVDFSGSSLAAGPHTVVACYDGDTNHDISEGSKSFTFTLASTATTVTPSPSSPREFGTSVTFTAAVTSGVNAVLAGNVRFIEGGFCSSPTTTLQGATAVNGSGEVAYTTTTLPVGSHTIVACYDGSGSYDISSGSAAYTINKIATTTGVTANKTSPQESGTSIIFTAEVNKTTGGSNVTSGSVVFYDGGDCTTPGTTLQSATAVDGNGKVTLTTSGLSVAIHTILACYEGTGTYAASSGTMSFEITKILTTTTVTALPASPQEFGTSVTFTAEVNKTTGGADVTSGSVTFYDGGDCTTPGTTLQSATGVDGDGKVTLSTSALTATTHTIVACYGGNTTYEASGDDMPYMITPIATTTSVSGSPNPSVTGQSVTFTATVTMHAGVDAVTTGAVTFRVGGTNCSTGTAFSGPTSVNTSGQATGSRSFNATETGATIRACYTNADTNYDPSDGTTTQTVNKAAASATLSSDNNPSDFGENVTLSSVVSATSPGSGSPSGTVSFYEFTGVQSCSSLGVATAIGSGTIASGTASATLNTLSVGTHVLTACYEGDSNFLTSQSSTISQVVDPAATTTVLGVAPASQQYSDTTVLTATVTPYSVLSEELTGTVYFYVDASSISCGTSAPAGYVGSDAIADADDGVGTFRYRVSKPAGSYTVTACFYSTNGSFANSNDTEALGVTAENAVVFDADYLPSPAQVTTAGGYSGTITLSLKVKERYAETNSDLALAGLGGIDSAVVVASGTGILSASHQATFACSRSGSVTGTGYSRYQPWQCTTSTLPADTYDVAITVNGGYYTATDELALQVTDPSLGFATGGGWFMMGGDRVNFGFQAKASVSKNKTNYQGSVLVIRHLPDGSVIRAKSNVFDGYSILTNAATFTGKATYNVDGNSLGNFSFTGYAEDNGTPGTGSDRFGLYLAYDGNQIATSQTLAGLKTSATVISGGNIQVPQPAKK